MADVPEWLERIAKRIAEGQLPPRQPPQQRYRLDWSVMLPYTKENAQFIIDGGVGSCVYELWQYVKGGRTAVYIGETKDLGTRLNDHMQKTEPNPNIKNADFGKLLFSYALLDGPISRKAVERGLWRIYVYPWNDKDGPQGGRVNGLIRIDEVFPEYYSINFNGVRQPMLGVSSPVFLP